MDWIFLALVVFLFILAVSDLWVGVSNDAVNFLNSAIGSKAAGLRTVITIAAVGVFCGAVMSNGMMDVARHGIFRPEQFSFNELMFIFLAVMVTDIILLDTFNTLGMPTSTTVSMVFELLGATFAFSIFKLGGDLSGEGLSHYMNTEKALSVIMAIFVSVAIAFVTGSFVQYIARLIFSFRYSKGLKWKIGLFGGLAATAILYFMLFKSIKSMSFMTEGMKDWLSAHTLAILGCSFAFFTVLMQVLHFCKINVFKVIVLMGTFSLATAFAGNDLVNFIGVPLTGLSAYQDFTANAAGASPEEFLMGSLNEPASTNPLFLGLAGLIMVIALYSSKKAQNVTMTEINLAKQEEGEEMFGSSKVARSLVRMANITANAIVSATPQKVRNWIDHRFDKTDMEIEDGAAYDLVRASVNLVTASLLIALGTSLKLPLSTTYVTFMVAMGTSLADRAWSRESAVFRITGVLSVIGGWFLTAGIAFASSFIIGLIMHFGGVPACIVIVLGGLAALVHSNIKSKKSLQESEGDRMFKEIINGKGDSQSWRIFGNYVAFNQSNLLRSLAKDYENVTDGLICENVKLLRKVNSTIRDEKSAIKNIRRKETVCLRRIRPEVLLGGGTWFHSSANELEEIYYSVRRICEPVYEHIDNNFSPLPARYVSEFVPLRSRLVDLMENLADICLKGDFEMMRNCTDSLKDLQESFSDKRKALLEDIQKEETNMTVCYLYLDLLLESEQIVLVLLQFTRSARKFQLG